MLKGKKILLGITGSIAAYKSILLLRLLVKAGAEVKIIMTESARNFVSPLVLSTLSGNKVLEGLFEEDTWANHVMLGRWADVMLIAPLSCNTLSKMANGQCDSLLLAVYLSATCPVVVSPAMDEDMWHHAATKRNIALLESYGNTIIPVENGELASGLIGEGRMAEPETIVEYLITHFFRGTALNGKKVLITAGPTYEAIDPVRFIGNHSSGKMGFALAEAFYLQGAKVCLVTGPTAQSIQYKGIELIAVTDAAAMYNNCMSRFTSCDIAVMSAAVADYTPTVVADEKIKKAGEAIVIELTKTKDILKAMGAVKRDNQLLVGFALETNNENAYAIGKLESKNADMIVLNSLRDANAGFGFDTNKVTIFDRNGNNYPIALASKKDIAGEIIHLIINKIHG
ncbi:bifunctional phosphopantothenoylcysteine decarboxylase/phosphopantothenate--cysteine ligase CoaBC [Limnovirga soli]|uniref:Coenzyme A biosynthesis bifunctional protein CoaBC n=1 Tax=Limnovirga soli TaxID=2656915 RepID=A0A8J8JVW8_9BACT|nr:bifunctional phosphopantothenoylcysteine decarboxylase/phosphopantothenate--cysteine ligase CoaBC [Limnovirga soli]NNV57815.1 bifunctional phosphopantothenoylcysteine decarboxylase/phosphopantothenate--cysteine ligase CoaBC [Limnovirga soli]